MFCPLVSICSFSLDLKTFLDYDHGTVALRTGRSNRSVGIWAGMGRLLLVSLALGFLAASAGIGSGGEGFVIKPYLQLGQAPALSNPESLTVVWHARDVEEEWRVRVRPTKNAAWRAASRYRAAV